LYCRSLPTNTASTAVFMEVMTFELLAIDLGKSSFHLHSIASDGTILSRKVSRSKLAEIVKAIAPKTVAMEACASAHHWGGNSRVMGERFC